MSNGRGIFMSRNIDYILGIALDNQENANLGKIKNKKAKINYVVQEYIERPHKFGEYKYDLRFFVTIYGVQPLRIYLHKYAFARVCLEAYDPPTNANLKNLYAHMTNYSLTQYKEYTEDQDDEEGETGHKKSLGSVLELIKKQGGNPDLVMA